MPERKSIAEKARRIRLLMLDVDGVMTDGGIYYSSRGVELKRFNAQDGYGVVRAREHGLRLAIVTGRKNPIVTARARDLQIADVFQAMDDKTDAAEVLKRRYDLRADELAFLGDDLFDLELLRSVGLSAAPADALPDVRRSVDLVTRSKGGEGAVREFIDIILRHQTPRKPGSAPGTQRPAAIREEKHGRT